MGLDVISLVCRAYVGLIQDHCGLNAAIPRMPDLNFDLRKEKVRGLLFACPNVFVPVCILCACVYMCE